MAVVVDGHEDFVWVEKSCFLSFGIVVRLAEGLPLHSSPKRTNTRRDIDRRGEIDPQRIVMFRRFWRNGPGTQIAS